MKEQKVTETNRLRLATQNRIGTWEIISNYGVNVDKLKYGLA